MKSRAFLLLKFTEEASKEGLARSLAIHAGWHTGYIRERIWHAHTHTECERNKSLSFAVLFSSQTPSCVTLKVALVSITLINGVLWKSERTPKMSPRCLSICVCAPLCFLRPVFNSISTHFSSWGGRLGVKCEPPARPPLARAPTFFI